MLLTAVVVWTSAVATFEAVRPETPPAVSPTYVETGSPTVRLAKHVLFVVVDGLRYDVATDSLRMPRFSEALRTHTSGEIWAGTITMTSSAVLTYGTGQRGSLDQILENLRPPSVNTNSWLENSHRLGQRIMAVGDPAWFYLYGKWLAEFRPDPEGVGIQTDFNLQTFRGANDLIAKRPDLLVAHFVTPDHQGHAYGIQSPGYRKHILDFDRALFDWLASIDPDWTVIVTSDHGASDSGTHGTDTDLQRRSPIFAYGPGIQPQLHLARRLDQVELPGLFAALLGVSTAHQGRGIGLYEWLDLSSVEKGKLACAEVKRLAGLAATAPRLDLSLPLTRAQSCCASVPRLSGCGDEASALAATYDVGLGSSQGVHSTRSWLWAISATVAAIAAAFVAFGSAAAAPTAWGGLFLAISLLLTYSVERLPGILPNTVRALVLAVANGVLLVSCTRFKRVAPLAHRYPALAMAVLPGWLLVSYTTNTQVEAFIIVVVFSIFLLVGNAGALSPWSALRRLGARGHRIDLIAMVVSIGLLVFPGTRASDVCPTFLARSPQLAAAVAGTLLVLGLAYLLKAAPDSGDRSSKAKLSYALIVIALLSLVFRHFSISWVGRAAIIATGVGTVLSLLNRNLRWALVWGVASYAWVSRDFEWIAFMPALILAAGAGRAFAFDLARDDSSREETRLARTLLFVTLLFALCMLQRVGLQGGLQLTTPDFTAGTFGDHFVPNWVVGLCLTYKFVLAQVLLLCLALAPLPAAHQRNVLLGVGAAQLARGSALLLMLFICGESYWTAFRVVADLPFALIGVLTVVLVASVRFLPSRVKKGSVELVPLQ